MVWVNLTVSLLRKESSGSPDCFVSTVEDITARKLGQLVPDPLTLGETDVLRLVALGQTNRDIAKDLRYSVGTVNSRVGCILSKLSVKNRREAVKRAFDIGLLPPAEVPNRPTTKQSW